ncbi:hypothetical protein TNCV_604531 [Trichonephila clavipes]|nr:hypothetical protein TNCV_604531 [Trichonephila clavipes]
MGTAAGGGGRREKQLQWVTDMSSCRQKEPDTSASLIAHQLCAAIGRQVSVYCGQTLSQRWPIHWTPLKVSHQWDRLQ